jgi:hypothetical protein
VQTVTSKQYDFRRAKKPSDGTKTSCSLDMQLQRNITEALLSVSPSPSSLLIILENTLANDNPDVKKISQHQESCNLHVYREGLPLRLELKSLFPAEKA